MPKLVLVAILDGSDYFENITDKLYSKMTDTEQRTMVSYIIKEVEIHKLPEEAVLRLMSGLPKLDVGVI